jgi:hypothetical protein
VPAVARAGLRFSRFASSITADGRQYGAVFGTVVVALPEVATAVSAVPAGCTRTIRRTGSLILLTIANAVSAGGRDSRAVGWAGLVGFARPCVAYAVPAARFFRSLLVIASGCRKQSQPDCRHPDQDGSHPLHRISFAKQSTVSCWWLLRNVTAHVSRTVDRNGLLRVF